MEVTARPVIAERTAQAIWAGRLASGSGTVTSGSGALHSLPVTWAARTGLSGGKTSPEELAAAAHASCFSMALALALGDHGLSADRLEVMATVSLDDVDGRPTVVSSHLRVIGQVIDVDQERFGAIVEEAADLCPISRLFAGAAISVDAMLDET
jgi:osmotically inducible protein OsmC